MALRVQFTDTSLNNPTAWAWTFGDGGTSTLQNPIHDYNTAGIYSVSLTASNVGGSNVFTRAGYITVTSAADTTPPTVPTGLSSSNTTAAAFTVSWSASTDNVGVAGYEVQVNGGVYGTTTGTSLTISGRTASTTYTVQVRAYDAAGNYSALSSALTVTTSVAADTTPPTVPANVSTSNVTSTGFTVSWSASSDTVGVAGYQVQINGSVYGTTANTTLPVTGRAGSTAYSVQVRAYDAAGNYSAYSSAVSVTTSAAADTSVPTTPTNVTASNVTSSGFTLNWTASTDNVGVTGYQVQINGAAYTTVTGTTANVTGRSASTAYSVQVRAYDTAGNYSSLSSAISVTTAAPSSTVLLNETFTGTNGATPNGWTLTGGTGSGSIQSNALRLTSASTTYGFTPVAYAASTATTSDFDITVDLTVTTLAEQYVGIGMGTSAAQTSGATAPSTGYSLLLYPGFGTFTAYRCNNSSLAALPSADVPFTFTAGSVLHVNMTRKGTAIQAFLWYGSTKPTTPTWSGTDTAPISVAMRPWLNFTNGNSTTPLTATFDNLVLTDNAGGN